ncbi:MAG: CotH kinase family protein [Chitinophagales bacterium]|nr:CotH kinase family protein [Chitinophagales bacterium]
MKPYLTLALLLFAASVTAQNPGDAFFSGDQIHEIRFQFSQTGFLDSLKANYTLDQYMRCDVTVDGVSFPVSGVKYKGNSSYNNQGKKKPFRIDFEEYTDNQKLDGMDKLVLNNAFKDPTFLREKMMLDFLNANGISAPRCIFVKLYINNQYWGLYSGVEDVEKTFLKTRFDNKGGNLFKGDPHGSLTWKGADPAMYYGDYELKTNEEENDWTDLVNLLNKLNNTPPAQLADSLDRYLNLDSWFSYWAAHNLFVNLDSYIGSGHNYFLYHNTDTDKFEWISWDVNEAFGNFNLGLTLNNLKTLPFGYIPNPPNMRPMMNKLWQDNVFKQRLADRMCELLQDFNNGSMDLRIDALANLIRPAVLADSLKTHSNALFEQNLSQDVNIGQGPNGGMIPGLKSFVTARRNALQQQLQSYGCSTSAVESLSESSIIIAPNPATDFIQINIPNQDILRVYLLDASGKLCMQWASKTNYEISNLPSGIYFLKVQTEEAVVSGRFLMGK